jgi:hypothetical protein
VSGVPAGSVTVEAKDLSGWSKPMSQTVSVQRWTENLRHSDICKRPVNGIFS